MTQNQQTKHKYDQYKKIIAQFPLKCKMYLTLLISHDEPSISQLPKAVKKNYQTLTNTFKRLTPKEQLFFIDSNVQFVTSHLKREERSIDQCIQQIDTSCEVKGSFIGMLSFWQKRMFRFQFNNSCIKLSTLKKMDIIQLRNYLIRKSQSQKCTFVLQAIDASIPEGKQKISVRFGHLSVFEEIYSNVRHCMIELSNKRIQALLREDMKDSSQSKFQEEMIGKGLTFLTPKVINQYFSTKTEIIKKLKTKIHKSFTIYNKEGVTMKNSAQSSKYYFMDYILPKEITSMQAAKESINIIGTKTMANRYYSQKLQSFTQNICAKYYKFTVDPLQCESIMLVQTLEREGKLQQIMKGTQNIFLGINITFMNIEVIRGQNNRYTFSLQSIIKSSTKYKYKSKDMIKLMLAMINSNQYSVNTSLNESSPTKKSQEEYIPKKGHNHLQERPFQLKKSIGPSINQSKVEKNSSNQQGQIFYSIENEQAEGQKVQEALNSYSSKNVVVPTHDIDPLALRKDSHSSTSYLNAKPFLCAGKQEEKKYITDSCLLKDFKKLPKGGVVCVNQQVINEQKKIFKLICKQFGSKLFKMQGVMSFSLPVQICKPESTLISVAKNIAYSPLLFENHTLLTPLQKLKNAIIFQISMATISLTTKTPLNPVIGQTYQGSINGCPVYLQQLTHHPAVSYLLFIGRGYEIYGSIGPIICIRLNYVKGVNPKWLTVQFQDGQKIELSQSTMIINGMLFGQRSIYFDCTNYVLDAKNGLIAQVILNAGSKGFFGSKESPDYLTAHIYQASPSFIQEFIASKKTKSPKNDERNKLLTFIKGQWNGTLIEGDKTIFNFQTQMPLLLQNYQHPLMSDSVYRSDAIELEGGFMNRAQEEKERVEELQRRDKRLRQAFMKSTKKK